MLSGTVSFKLIMNVEKAMLEMGMVVKGRMFSCMHEAHIALDVQNSHPSLPDINSGMILFAAS